MVKIIILFCFLLYGCSTISLPLKATLIKPKDSLAIIGNKVYHVGDFVDMYRRIEKIELEKVTLSDGSVLTAKLKEYE